MTLNIKQLIDIPGQQLPIDVELPLTELDFVKGYTFATPLSIKGKVFNRAGVVYLTMTISARIQALCDRCLFPFEREFTFNTEHIVVRSLSGEDNDEYILAPDNLLPLSETALSDFLLELPTKLLCSEDCSGIAYNS